MKEPRTFVSQAFPYSEKEAQGLRDLRDMELKKVLDNNALRSFRDDELERRKREAQAIERLERSMYFNFNPNLEPLKDGK